MQDVKADGNFQGNNRFGILSAIKNSKKVLLKYQRRGDRGPKGGSEASESRRPVTLMGVSLIV